MKKVISISLLVIMLCLVLTGCTKPTKVDVTASDEPESEWVLTFRENSIMLEDEIEKAFDNANEDYKEMELTRIALLAEQVVAGKNYMFLCKTNDAYKIAIVYRDLSGKSQITYVNDFDVKKYVNENSELNTEALTGGWETDIPGKPIMLDEDVQSAFDKASEKMVGATYYPIETIAKQEKPSDGTNYAVLCYGRLSNQNETTGVFVLTLHVNEANESEITSISAVDLKEFNK